MRSFLICLLCVLVGPLAGCGRGGTMVEGDFLTEGLAADDSVRFVWVVGREGRTEVEAGRFVLRGLAAGPLDIRFATAAGETGRMDLRDLDAVQRVRLHEIWFDRERGVAFPTRVDLRGAGLVTVNGIRMAEAARLPATLDTVAGVVLAASRAGDAILVRPGEEDLPDLRVVVGPLTDAQTTRGDSVSLEYLRAGDSIWVSGSNEAGYLLASRVVVPRAVAQRRPRPAPPPPAPAAEPAPPQDPLQRAWDAIRDRIEREIGGRGRGRGRGGPPDGD